MSKVIIGRRLLVSNTKSFDRELIKVNQFRKELGLKPIVVKIRKCNYCEKEFESMVGNYSDFNCGCLKYKGSDE